MLTYKQDTLLQNQSNPYRFLTFLILARHPWAHSEQKQSLRDLDKAAVVGFPPSWAHSEQSNYGMAQ